MNVEIITIGDELLCGHTVDTNAAHIADHLISAGFAVKYISTVGDSLEGMEEAFQLALKRADVVITTGGLGPTDDDITKRAIVRVFRRNLVLHDDILEQLKKRYADRGQQMPAISQNQALLPQGATFFPNKLGSAVGICIADRGHTLIALPGVPREMKQIIDDEVIPYLTDNFSSESVKTVTLRTTGITESRLAELIKPGLKVASGVKLAYLPSFCGVSLRITALGDEQKVVEEKVQQLVGYLEKTAGKYIYGRDDDTLETIVGQLLEDNDKTVGVAESCTGGQLGMMLTSVPGSSVYFRGGIVAYHNDVKILQLSVSPETLGEFGAVSLECAVAMADGCRKLLQTDYALSITGIAGPDGGSDEKPVGTTFIGLASTHTSYSRKFLFSFDRSVNRTRAAYAALEMLRRDILDIES
ncbi:MAG: competence/damage-inducible protein A [Candidatus Zixiibacteriota bacterium]|nr:MAG: competence/damage-inducible protein A [candidate division Zixibacteria bacterium]